ncbi:hypothetical protein [Phenylobacterium sp.]|uniref:hypothetical protein n=1 Tax=Phenylobacterium sp. TaxID=1871053 RepID=UPI00121E9E1D|nr:hypothetical protein [Phenylobacterium sp.]THD53608.1 MAG: hypothetical protein E8A12_18330 [Phenylobacterium sp.]
MSDAESYRERAAMAERLASEMTTGSHREQLLKIAGDWRLMAQKAEAAEKAAQSRPDVVVDFPIEPSLDNPSGDAS